MLDMNPFWIGVFAAGIGCATVLFVFAIIVVCDALAMVRSFVWTRNPEPQEPLDTSSISELA